MSPKRKPQKKIKRGNVINRHHLCYDPEIIVKLFRKEHWAMTFLGRLNPISRGLIRALRYYIKENKNRAININKLNKELNKNS